MEAAHNEDCRMPNRLVRVGLLTSARVNRLSDAAECLYHRLLLVVDDAGRTEGALEVVRSRCFPLGNRSLQHVGKALQECIDAGLLAAYECRGTPYLQVLRWHRCGNATRSKYPWMDGSYRILYVTLETPDGAREFVATSIPTDEISQNAEFAQTTISHRHGIGIPSASHRHGIEVEFYTKTKTETKTETKIDSSETNCVRSEPPPSESPPTESRGPPSDPARCLLEYPCVGPTPIWRLTADKLEQWRALYPNIDVELELRKALAWVQAHEKRRKTARGMERFLVGWLNRAVDHSPNLGGPQHEGSRHVVCGKHVTRYFDRIERPIRYFQPDGASKPGSDSPDLPADRAAWGQDSNNPP